MAMILQAFESYAAYYTALLSTNAPPSAAFLRQFYALLAAYYNSNGLYSFIRDNLQTTSGDMRGVLPLRNPANRAVEFYASKLWPGQLPAALPIEAEDERIIPAIHQLWQWSNFSSRKQRMARWFALYGDVFLKIATRRDDAGQPTSVYIHLVKPEFVSEMELDERGYFTYVRLDVPDGEETHTEVWDKAAGDMTIWRHKQGADAALDRLGAPAEMALIADLTGDDFIPIVYQPFRDDGEGRGGGCFAHVLDKMDEANRQATRLHQMLFRHNRPLWALLANTVDAQGRPMPAPDVTASLNGDGELGIADDDMIRLPGMSRLEPLTPAINYADALRVLQDMAMEIRSDLPELAYYDLRDMNQVSGRAVRLMLDDAISRLLEARGNAESALVRAHEMALTIAGNLALPGFTGLGSYQSGDFEHRLADRPALPLDELERAQIATTLAGTYNARASALAAGYSDEEADELSSIEIPGGVER